MLARLARRVLPLPVALARRRSRAGGHGLVAHTHPHALPWGGASLPSFAAAFALAVLARSSQGGLSSRARDRAARKPLARPLPGAARRGSAAAPTTAPAHCSGCASRRGSSRAAQTQTATTLLPPLVRLGTPVRYVPGRSTATFSFSYDGDVRTMTIERLGDVWQPADRPRAARPLGARRPARRARSCRRRRSQRSPSAAASRSTAKGSCACPRSGRCVSTTTSTADMLRHVWVLKLADEEAEVLGDLGGARRARGRRHPRLAGLDGALRRHRRVRSGPCDRRRPDRKRRRVRHRVHRRPQRRPQPCRRSASGDRSRRVAARPVIALVETAAGTFAVDLETDEVEAADEDVVARGSARRSTCRGSSRPPARGATVVAVVDAKPPLLVSHDAGSTWRAAGRGLPPGRASRSAKTTLTRSSTPVETGCSCRATAASSGARSPASCRRSAPCRSETELAARDR